MLDLFLWSLFLTKALGSLCLKTGESILHRLPRTFARMDLGVSSEPRLCKYSESTGEKGKGKSVLSPTLQAVSLLHEEKEIIAF